MAEKESNKKPIPKIIHNCPMCLMDYEIDEMYITDCGHYVFFICSSFIN